MKCLLTGMLAVDEPVEIESASLVQHRPQSVDRQLAANERLVNGA